MTSGPTSPTLFEQCHGFFYVPFQLKYKDEGDKANGLTSPPNDAIIWTEKGVSHDLTSYVKTLADGPAGVWTHDLPLSRPALVQHELTGRRFLWVEKTESKDFEKTTKYGQLRLELTNWYPEYKVNQYNIIMDVHGGCSKEVEQNIKQLVGDKCESIMCQMQKAILSSSLHIARMFKLSG